MSCDRWLWATAAALMLASMSARAADAVEPDEATKAAARQLAQDGVVALEAGRYSEARDLLGRAYELYPAPTIAVLQARALEKQGRLVEAAERYELARRTRLDENATPAFRAAVVDADREVQALRRRIPQLTIQIEGVAHDHPALDVRLNGARVPIELLGVRRPVDPGEHRITARVGNGHAAERLIRVAEQRDERVVMTLSAPATPAAEQPANGSVQRTWGWASLGIGAAGLATGAIAGLVMLDKKSSLDDACTPTCPAQSEGDLDAFRRARTISLIGYGVGLAGAGAGLVLLLTAPRESQPAASRGPRFDLSLGDGSVAIGASGRFR